jgi:hypothetical protein
MIISHRVTQIIITKGIPSQIRIMNQTECPREMESLKLLKQIFFNGLSKACLTHNQWLNQNFFFFGGGGPQIQLRTGQREQGFGGSSP